ncbi:PKD domain-containing protein [Myxococcota bacterium]|nr:PKD domain-containing protein [Myxococcota bacterium]
MLRAISLVALLTGCAPSPAPVADAGALVVGAAGDVYLLDGSSSQGEGLRYAWALVDGPADAAIIEADAQAAYLQPTVEGAYTLSLTVCDRWDRCDEAETFVLVGEAASRQRLASFGGLGLGVKPFGKNRAPTADAVAIRSLGGGTIKLDGSASSDPDGDSLRYRWTFTSRPAGSALTDADIQDASSALASFQADVAGTYSVRLIVRDGMLSDSTTLPGLVVGMLNDDEPWDSRTRHPGEAQTAESAQRSSAPGFGGLGLSAKPFGKNRAPEADAIARRSMGLGGLVKLDGSASSDPDGDSLRYRWTFTARPAGSALTDADIQDSTSALASFTGDVKGTYGVKLVVRDGMLADSVVLPDIVLGYVDDNEPLEHRIHYFAAPVVFEAAAP